MRTALLSLTLCLAQLPAQGFEFYPGAKYDPAVPTMQSVSGHDWGEKISSHAEALRYVEALAAASPRVRLFDYGESWQGRRLCYMVVGSESNLGRLEEIQAGLARLADPRGMSDADAEESIESLPSVVWLANSVHGDEISGTDAGTLTAYHLAAATNDEVARTILAESLVIIDPMENPDGRDRFVNNYRNTRGRWVDADQQAAEHSQPWPGGRVNHYLFDMNRDWFAISQPETEGRVREFLRWYPQVYVDLHEMGSNSSYYFAPPAEPHNEEVTAGQQEWWQTFGRNNARWFDRMQFDYFTREVFDSYYPGYGDGWPTLHGSIGMTYEQASVRGLAVKRDDETMMLYADSVQRHFIASIGTAETAARGRTDLLRYFYEYRRDAAKEGSEAPIKEFILVPGADPSRVNRLVGLLVQQGIEVRRATNAFSLGPLEDYYGGKHGSKDFPAGSFLVSSAQPAKHLLYTLMNKGQELEEKFLAEQIRRQKKRLPAQMYDITAWSLPLLFDVEGYMSESGASGSFEVLQVGPATNGRIIGDQAQVAYLLPWGSQAAARALASMHRTGLRASVAHKSFTIHGRDFAPGAIIVKVKDNPEDLHEKLSAIAEDAGVDFYATDTSWVEKGVNFGSNNVKHLPKPKIALVYNRPTSANSVGWTRYLLEQVYGYPVTLLNGQNLAGADLNKYNVLVIPETRGGSTLDPAVARIKTWIRAGGTLIALGSTTQWLTSEKVGLLSSEREYKPKPKDKKDKSTDESKAEEGKAGEEPTETKAAEPDAEKAAAAEEEKEAAEKFDLEKAIQPEKELPAGTPGAILKVNLDTEHWLAFGYDEDTNVLVSSRNIYKPVTLDRGRNVGVYAKEEELVLSGFVWEDSKSHFAQRAFLVHQSHGRGQVVAFAEDPNYRAFCDGLNLLFMNGVFFGPAEK